MLFAFPSGLREEIERLSALREGVDFVSEIRLRSYGRCSITLGGERICLCSKISKNELSELVSNLSGGAFYSSRDSLGKGYLSLDHGVRVGVAGCARYDGGELVGISDVSSLVFRIPTGRCDFENEITCAFLSCRRGMLIYSPPGVGKTAALRSLVFGLASRGENVALVDERREFFSENFEGLPVDVLSGYRRADGFEIALRTLSPDVIAVDEIGRLEEVGAIMESLGSGVRLAITAHAGSISEIRKRAVTAPLIENGMVDMLVGLSIENGERRIAIEGIENEAFRAFCDSDCGARGISGVFEPCEEEALRM